MQLLLYSAFRVTDYSLFLIFLLLIKDQTLYIFATLWETRIFIIVNHKT